ncbi:flavin reductase family protein [Streptomyces niger]|uniref:flavin reductase family protein n=1 Tax=Streptomyces niger TaxID=66373 RepID=UPI00069C11AC|nr:flavin reductase family protein [Streptomyces niger]
MPAPATDFTLALSRVPSPVTVVTTTDATGRHWGFTASSFSSLSLDPPLILVCPAKSAGSHRAFVTADRFMVNVLAADQADIAARFARAGTDKFAGGEMVPCEFGLPGLPSAVARLACTRYDVLDGGDHSILVGHVDATGVTARAPLVYHDRDFARPAPAKELTAAL